MYMHKAQDVSGKFLIKQVIFFIVDYNMIRTCSIGFRSGDLGGVTQWLMLLLSIHSVLPCSYASGHYLAINDDPQHTHSKGTASDICPTSPANIIAFVCKNSIIKSDIIQLCEIVNNEANYYQR